MKSKNLYIIHEEYAEMILQDRNENEKARTLIDLDDLEILKKYRWCVTDGCYVAGWVDGSRIKLHRFVTNCPKGLVVDHINHNTFDNRKSNLRVCTQAQNKINTKQGKRGIEKISANYFQVTISVKGVRIRKGFKTCEEALDWRRAKEREIFGLSYEEIAKAS